MSRLFAVPFIIVSITFIAAACAPTASQKVEADIATIRKESDAKTLLDRGKAFATVGDHTRAEEYLTAALDAGADPRQVLPLLMDVCVRTGRYRSAIQHAEDHLRKHPRDVQTRVMAGALYAAINEGKQARAQLERAVKEMPPEEGGTSPEIERGRERLQAQAQYLLAVVARDSENDVVEADRHFREYLRIEPHGSHEEEARAALLKRLP
jgi:tetratricopeptide (TPR) repeat protein